MSTQVRCDSGLMGWQSRLQDNYDSFGEWQSYAETYSLHVRLGYETVEEAWHANPLIQGSVNPNDFRKVANPPRSEAT